MKSVRGGDLFHGLVQGHGALELENGLALTIQPVRDGVLWRCVFGGQEEAKLWGRGGLTGGGLHDPDLRERNGIIVVVFDAA